MSFVADFCNLETQMFMKNGNQTTKREDVIMMWNLEDKVYSRTGHGK